MNDASERGASHSPSAIDVADRSPREVLVERALWILVAIALVVGIVGGVHRGKHQRPDWSEFFRETRYVWEHHRTHPGTSMFGYLPTATFLLWPFTTWAPEPIGAVCFVIINTAAAIAAILIVSRYWFPSRIPPPMFALPAALAAANFSHSITANQLTLLTLLLCIGGLTLVGRDRQYVGGGLIGLAVLIKSLPAILAVYLLLTRRWRALLGIAAAGVLFDVVPSVMFFGPRGALDEHRAWIRRAGWHSNKHMIEQPFLRVHRHSSNAAYSAVLTRWLRKPPEAMRQVILYGKAPEEAVDAARAGLADDELLTLDPMPPPEGAWAKKRVDDLSWVPRFHLADLSPGAVRLLWASSLALGFIVLSIATWRAAGRPDFDWAPIAAVWIVAMLWPSPMMRHYYLAWAFPALASVWSALAVKPIAGKQRSKVGCLLGVFALGGWLIGVLCLGWPAARWYGVHLAALVMLCLAGIWSWRFSAQARGEHPADTGFQSGGGGELRNAEHQRTGGATPRP